MTSLGEDGSDFGSGLRAADVNPVFAIRKNSASEGREETRLKQLRAWGNETLKLRVVNTSEQQAYLTSSGSIEKSSTTPGAIQAEALELGKKEGWQTTLIYFENAERELYQVVLAENIKHIQQTLQEGLVRVGFIGGKDAPKGIQFSFSLDDGIPTNGKVAKRFLINGREWVTNRSKEVCAQKGVAPPIVNKLSLASNSHRHRIVAWGQKS